MQRELVELQQNLDVAVKRLDTRIDKETRDLDIKVKQLTSAEFKDRSDRRSSLATSDASEAEREVPPLSAEEEATLRLLVQRSIADGPFARKNSLTTTQDLQFEESPADVFAKLHQKTLDAAEDMREKRKADEDALDKVKR